MMNNDKVSMTIIVEPRKSESLTIFFKEGILGTTTNTYELDLEDVDKEEKLKYVDKNTNANLVVGKTLPTKIMKIICVYKQQVLPIWKDKDKDKYYCVFIKEDIHRSQHPVSNSSLDKILELYKDHIDTSKYITSENYDLELEVNYKDEVRNYYNLPSADDTVTKFINQIDSEKMKTLKNKIMKVESRSEALKVNYNGYTLEIEEVKNDKGNTEYYTANCAELPYFPYGIFMKTDLAFIISYFKRTVHYYTFNELNKKEEGQINNTIAACNTLVKQILEDFPNSADNLCNLLLDFKYKLEEGVGQKE